MVVHLEFTKILDDTYEIIDKGLKTERKIFNDKRYEDAYESYKEIYNEAMVRGKGDLDPQDLEGKPIQLDINNYTSLVTDEYFVSTKADGLRFLMMFSNGFDKPFIDRAPQGISQVGSEPNYRNIYFIDSEKINTGSKLNFWYINRIETNQQISDKYVGDIPGLLGVAKCLIDGELLMWGNIDKTFGSDGSVIKYTVSQDLATEPVVVFLAFDIMYGPTHPRFKSETHQIVRGSKMDTSYKQGPTKTIKSSNRNILEFGSSGAMLGFKGAERWPTEDRRWVLETMFNNQYSHIIRYLQDIAPYNFTILVSPFVPMEIMLNYDNPYEYMKKIYEEEIKIQYQRNMSKNIQNSSILTMFTDTSEFNEKKWNKYNAKRKLEVGNELTFDEWVNFEKRSKSVGKGILDDGLIFTPKFQSYIIGPWTFCGNKQYKWKPAEELTIDFRVGELVSDEDSYVYSAEIGMNSLFKYMDKNTFIESEDSLQEGSIVETSVQDIKTKSVMFAFKQIRYDKTIPNAYRTAKSVMNAYMLFANGIDILQMIKMMREKIEIDDEQAKIIVSLMDPDFLYKNCVLQFDKKKEEFKQSSLNDEVMKIIDSDENLELGATSLLSLNEKKEFMKLIDKVKNNNNLELEGRITFKDEHRPYSLCLVSKTIGKKHETVPMIRAYGSKTDKGYQYRSTYISLGQTLMHENTMKKKDKSSFDINVQKMNVNGTVFSLYNEVENVKITLASEKNVDMSPNIKKTQKKKEECKCGEWGCDECFGDQDIHEIKEGNDSLFKSREKLVKKYLYAYGSKDPEKVLKDLEPELKSDKPLSEIIHLNFGDITNTKFETDVFFNYQIRHMINSMSLFWKVEVIEYGSAKTWQEAEKRLDAGPSNDKYPDGRNYIKNNGARTRIEIEFAPAAFFEDYLKFYKENPNQKTFMDIVEMLNLDPENFKEKTVKQAYDEFEKIISFFNDKLRESPAEEILEDYMNVLVSVLNSFYN
jgi:hypothetical protein